MATAEDHTPIACTVLIGYGIWIVDKSEIPSPDELNLTNSALQKIGTIHVTTANARAIQLQDLWQLLDKTMQLMNLRFCSEPDNTERMLLAQLTQIIQQYGKHTPMLQIVRDD